MPTEDKCCSIVPYFDVPNENLDAFKGICERMVSQSKTEPKCLYYGFSFHENEAHCREAYADAEGVLAHLSNVEALLGELLKAGEMKRMEIHGPEEDLAKLRAPLSKLNPVFFVLEYGFRR